MPYHAYKEGKGFRIVHESWRDGKRARRSIPKREWPQLGFNRCISIDEARETAKHLNSVERQEFLRNRAAMRMQRDAGEAYIFLPPLLLARFEEEIARRFRHEHWLAAKKAIRAVGIAPAEWHRRAFKFYDWLEAQRYSPDYSKRILRMVNEWGYFFAEQQGAFFRPVPFPRGPALRKIRRAYYTKGRGPSRRLFFRELKAARRKLTDRQYHWLLLTVAFGLRPEEVDQGRDLMYVEGGVLVCFQPKMLRLGERPERCWKRVPAKLKFQRAALAVLQAPRQRPSREKLREVFGAGLTYYAGRKGYSPYMQQKGFSAYQVAKWMGHKGLETMRRHYDED